MFVSGLFKNWEPGYDWPKELHVLDIVVGMLGLGVMITIFHWINR
jgi:hypothetical protein